MRALKQWGRGVAVMSAIKKPKKMTASQSLSNPQKLRIHGGGIYSPVMEFSMDGDRKTAPSPVTAGAEWKGSSEEQEAQSSGSRCSQGSQSWNHGGEGGSRSGKR